MSDREKNIKSVQFSAFPEENPSPSEMRTIDLLLDIPLQLSVELGRTSSRVKEILEWEPGSIIEVNKLAGEPVDVMVNSHRIARGEVLVLDENFGVRITNIASQRERLTRLK